MYIQYILYLHIYICTMCHQSGHVCNTCYTPSRHPTNNALLINFLLSSDAEILLISTDWAYESAQNVQKRVCNVYIFRLSFHFAFHHWWLGVTILFSWETKTCKYSNWASILHAIIGGWVGVALMASSFLFSFFFFRNPPVQKSVPRKRKSTRHLHFPLTLN